MSYVGEVRAAVVSLSDVELGLDGLIVDRRAFLVAGGLRVVGVAGRNCQRFVLSLPRVDI